MPINKLALIRYKTIDACLQNHYRKWTLDDLITSCNEALYDLEGIKTGVSRRTVQSDIQFMRSSKLGYNAPIVVTDRKYYSYETKNYSITNIPLSSQDLGTLNEVLDILNQLKGFSYFRDLNAMVTRLEDKVYKHQHKGKSFIDFEKNDLLKGLMHIDPLHKAIIHRKAIHIIYQSFKSRAPQDIIFYPYLLKEYRNRWFVLGTNKKGFVQMILALDRIVTSSEVAGEKYIPAKFDVATFFDDVVGVSKGINQRAQQIVMKISRQSTPYILTKPLHPSQIIRKEDQDGTIFSIQVVWNFELEREILGFGEEILVLSPKRLQNKIQQRLRLASKQYEDLINMD